MELKALAVESFRIIELHVLEKKCASQIGNDFKGSAPQNAI
jgi:hypothetical protein